MKSQYLYVAISILMGSSLASASNLNVAVQCSATTPVSATLQVPDLKDCQLAPETCGAFDPVACYVVQCNTPVVLVYNGVTYSSDTPVTFLSSPYYIPNNKASEDAFRNTGLQVLGSTGASVKSSAGYELFIDLSPTNKGQALSPTSLESDQLQCSVGVQ